jgi:uncharacterized membrane protein
MKLILHVIFFIAGAGVGIWWGVNHPTQAQSVSATEEQEVAKIQAAASQEKIDLINRFMGHAPSDQDAADLKQMLSDEKQKLQTATAKLSN